MRVELRPVHAGKLPLAADRQAAAAAHARAVYHYRVQARRRPYAVGPRRLRNVFHHDDGTAGQHGVVLHARLQQLLELRRDKALLAVAAVVSRYIQVVRSCPELVLHDDDVRRPEAANHVDRDTQLLELLRNGVVYRAAGTAAHDADALRVRVYLRRAPQRPDDVRYVVPRLDE